MKKKIFLLVFILTFAALRMPTPVHADMAPPETPPGANLVPGVETTQVRMAAETVTLTIAADPADPMGAIAHTTATFTMRNLGSASETMQARFPLTFFNGNSDGYGNFPEIAEIAVRVNGKSVSTRRELQSSFPTEFSYHETQEIPWAVFEVTFPPAQDVIVEVSYTVSGYGYYPYEVFRYVLETGAGWNGTIGNADIIIRFPYEATRQNVWMENAASSGYGDPTSGGALSGNEIRWHFENLEPTSENNIEVIVVSPALWERVLKESQTVAKNPKDGEAWGRLGKAYKDVVLLNKGLRDDSAGLEMFRLSRAAYETCLTLLPNDSLWHYGYADLLWAHYYWNLRWSGVDSEGILPLALSHLKTALAIDPNNQLARDLLTNISYSVDGAVQVDGNNFIYLALTATPLPPTPWPTSIGLAPSTPTGMATPILIPVSTAAPTEMVVVPTAETPTKPNPVCGSSALILPILVGGVWAARRKKN